MERRGFLATTGVGFLIPVAGCSGTVSDGSDDTESSPGAASDEKPNLGVRFEERGGDTGNLVRERILIRNESDQSIEFGGYTLRYSSGHEYVFSGGLSVEPYAEVAVLSRGEGDGIAESDPPTHYRDANLPEPVLRDGEETVRLLDRNGELLVEKLYSD